MNELFERLAICIERGKIDINSVYPKDLNGQIGAVEYTKQCIEQGINVNDILQKGLVIGMQRIGERFSLGKAYIPDLMIASKAMNAASKELQPFFDSGEAQIKGKFIIGTVQGDHHDIGKNIIRMALEGHGYKVIDLGTNVTTEKFITACQENPNTPVGMSALLTTTMQNMEKSVKILKEKYSNIKIFIGGAPVTMEFSNKIGADGYYPTPFELIKALEA